MYVHLSFVNELEFMRNLCMYKICFKVQIRICDWHECLSLSGPFVHVHVYLSIWIHIWPSIVRKSSTVSLLSRYVVSLLPVCKVECLNAFFNNFLVCVHWIDMKCPPPPSFQLPVLVFVYLLSAVVLVFFRCGGIL